MFGFLRFVFWSAVSLLVLIPVGLVLLTMGLPVLAVLGLLAVPVVLVLVVVGLPFLLLGGLLAVIFGVLGTVLAVGLAVAKLVIVCMAVLLIASWMGRKVSGPNEGVGTWERDVV
jgi:hypothetical protein